MIRWLIRIEGWLNHPESRPWPGYPGSRWGPRCPWLCVLADWLTKGACHD